MKLLLNLSAGIAMSFLSVFSAKGQYTVVPLSPPPSFSFADLWHFSVVRGTTDDKYVHFYVSLRVFNENSLLKVKSNTAMFTLNAGSRYFSLGDQSSLQPFETSFYDAGHLQNAISSGGLFPPGSYRMIYTLWGKAPDGAFTPLAEGESEVTVPVLWPPMLLSPGNGDTIDTSYPLLTWTPAFAGAAFHPVEYTLKMVELLPGQHAYQAMAANPSHYTEGGLLPTMLPYPPSARPLDTNKVYAWQVHAGYGGVSLGSSEIWTFLWRRRKPEQKDIPVGAYFRLSLQTQANFVRVDKAFLPVVVEERYTLPPDAPLAFRILDENKKVVGTEKDFGEALRTGFNRYLIPVCPSEGKLSLPAGRYYFECRLEKSVTLHLSFEIGKGNCNG